MKVKGESGLARRIGEEGFKLTKKHVVGKR